MNQIAQPDFQHALKIGLNTFPYLRDHRVGNTIVLPASVHLELALAVGTTINRTSSCSLEQVRLHESLVITAQEQTVAVNLMSKTENRWAFEIKSLQIDTNSWCTHVTGFIQYHQELTQPEPINRERILAACTHQKTSMDHLNSMKRRNIHYGPAFHVVKNIRFNDKQALATLQLPDSLQTSIDQLYQIHPVLLDGSIQAISATRPDEDRLSLPNFIGSLQLFGKIQSPCWAYVVAANKNHNLDGLITMDIILIDSSNEVRAKIQQVHIQEITSQQALPHRDQSANHANPDCSQTELIERLSMAWREVLGLSELKPYERFFDLGGDSIMATQIANNLQREHIHIKPQDILEAQTILTLVQNITK